LISPRPLAGERLRGGTDVIKLHFRRATGGGSGKKPSITPWEPEGGAGCADAVRGNEE